MLSLVEIGPVVLQKFFLTFVNVSPLFRLYLLLEKSLVLYLKKIEFPLLKDVWSIRLIEIMLVVSSLFRHYLSLAKGVVLQINYQEFLKHKDALCQVWLQLAMQVVHEKKRLRRRQLTNSISKVHLSL